MNSEYFVALWFNREPLFPIKYSAFQKNAEEINGEQWEIVMGAVQKTEHDFHIPLLAETASETKTKLRLGHRRFRNELLALGHDQCAFCEIELPELLQASYAKPWKDCTNNERINPNNGILLCRNHDALYHNGS